MVVSFSLILLLQDKKWSVWSGGAQIVAKAFLIPDPHRLQIVISASIPFESSVELKSLSTDQTVRKGDEDNNS